MSKNTLMPTTEEVTRHESFFSKGKIRDVETGGAGGGEYSFCAWPQSI